MREKRYVKLSLGTAIFIVLLVVSVIIGGVYFYVNNTQKEKSSINNNMNNSSLDSSLIEKENRLEDNKVETNTNIKIEGRYVSEDKYEVEGEIYTFSGNKVKCKSGDIYIGTYEIKDNKVIITFTEFSDIYEEETHKLKKEEIVELTIINENKLQNKTGLVYVKDN